MTMELLRCTVCPKQPLFSDLSHLLTHVSSKGHLAHLHKLQIRSYQELNAGIQVATYNQWYQTHGVDQLLLERMRQKEAKQANKKPATRGRIATAVIKQEPLLQLDPNVFQNSREAVENYTMIASAVKSPLQAALRSRRQAMQDEMNDPEYIPVLAPDYQSSFANIANFAMHTPPYKRASVVVDGNADTKTPLTVDAAKMKGVVWPGMTMFDAATEDMQKKRNQRKDNSILEYMQANSAMVEPMEVTYSPSGTMMRKRHIDDLETDDDLVEGEKPIRKRSFKKRKTQAGVAPTPPSHGRHRAVLSSRPSISTSMPRLGSLHRSEPLVSDQSLLRSQCFPHRSGTVGVGIGSTATQVKSEKHNLNVYPEGVSPFVVKTPSGPWSTPFLDPSRAFGPSSGFGLTVTPSMLLQQSESFSAQSYYPYGNYHSVNPMEITYSGTCSRAVDTNPLSWTVGNHNAQNADIMNAFDGAFESSFDNVNTDVSSLNDSLVYIKNPLTDSQTSFGQH